MEVVGVIAAIPGLIEIVQAVTTAVRGLSKRKVAAKTVEDLVKQLRDLEDILQDVQKRCIQGGSDRLRLQLVSPSLTELRNDLCSLKDILQASKLTKEPSRYLKRALFLSTSLEKTLKESLARLAQVKASLTLLIVHHQDDVTEELRGLSISGLRLKMRDLLRPSSDSFIPNKTHGTCEWIWSHPTFCDWVENSSVTSNSHFSQTLCIYGIKGCGKSVLIKSIAERLRGRGEIALHFSFWAGSEAQQKLLDLLRTLTWQILSHITDDSLKKLSEPLINDASINERVLVEAIRGALSMIGSKVYCAIDAIDESTEDWNSHADGCLATIINLAKSHTNFRLLLAGREPSLRTVLKQSYPRLEVTENLIRDDIHKLIVAELNDSLTVHTPVIRDMVEESLKAKTQVMFLWATLVFKELRRCFSVEEIKQTLKQVPHDLDREYHRLFSQLMIRTGGTLMRPSTSMKRARCLISSLLACPEPMTATDLCYAYAAQVNSSGTIEDDLITADGIMDACGDFVRVTDGRYHLIHTSASDFLTRPQNEWEAEDLDILYFRVDITEAQASMCSACFNYIESIDLGYPLTDNGASSLPSRHPFFPYVTKFLPFYFARVLEGGGWRRSQVSRFATRQFCGLIEYLLVTAQETFLQGSNGDFLYYWTEIFNAEFDSEVPGLAQAYNIELSRRRHSFGVHDERYQSWQSLAIFLPASTLKPAKPQRQPVTTSARNEKLPSVIEGSAFPSLPRYLCQTHGLGIQRLSHGLQAVSQIFVGFGKATTNLLASSAESLSIPMTLLAAQLAWSRGDMPLAMKFSAISVRKTRGNDDIYELCSLLQLAALKYYNTTDPINEIENMARESVQIANRLPIQPHVQFYKAEATYLLLRVLISQDKMEEAKQVTHSFETLIGKKREKCSSRLWEYGLCRTRRGTTYRMSKLRLVAKAYFDKYHYRAAMDMTAQAITVFEESGFKPNSEYRDSFVARRDQLRWQNEIDQCLASCHQILGLLKKLPGSGSEPNDIHIRWETELVLAFCLVAQGDMTEAQKWYCKAADEAGILSPESYPAQHEPRLEWLVRDLALMGQYERSRSTAQKLLEIKGVTYPDDKKDVEFHCLDALVCGLEEIGSIDSDWRGFLGCYPLLMAVVDLQDPEAEATWWQEILSLAEDRSISFTSKVILLRLKYIDTCLLRLDVTGSYSAYRHLARCFFEQGDSKAAELVSSDAVSRFFANLSYDSSFGLLLASDICVYTGRFSQRKILLSSAYERERDGNFNAHDDFETEILFASECLDDLEGLAGHVALEDLRLSFTEKACEHLLRAISTNHRIREHEARKLGINQSQDDDDDDDQEDRKADMDYFHTRLQDLGAGPVFDEACARWRMKEMETRQLRRAKSQEFARARPQPRKRVAVDDIHLYTGDQRRWRR